MDTTHYILMSDSFEDTSSWKDKCTYNIRGGGGKKVFATILNAYTKSIFAKSGGVGWDAPFGTSHKLSNLERCLEFKINKYNKPKYKKNVRSN